MAAQEDGFGEPVTRDVLGGNRIPAKVLDRYPRLVAGGLEANVNLCLLPRRKARLSPAEHQLGGWLPDLDAADLE